jgi:hypothetical protein
MPTLVEKGPLFRDLEQYLKDVDQRRTMLAALHSVGPVNIPNSGPPVALVNAIVDTVGPNGWDAAIYLVTPTVVPVTGVAAVRVFFKELWFTEASCMFQQILYPLTQENLNIAAEVFRIGMMDALEASMGITDSWRKSNKMPSVYALRRFWPIELNWVCGKLDGFEMTIAVRRLPATALHVSWKGAIASVMGGGRAPFKDGVVTVNITTPPVDNSVPGFMAGPLKDEIKKNRDGTLVTRNYVATGAVSGTIETRHLQTDDGGSNF